MLVERITSNLLSELSKDALLLSKRRKHLNLHKSYNEPSQKFFNAISIDSYICPHRHLLDSKDEFLIAIRGLFALITFDDVGNIENKILFGSDAYQKDMAVDSAVFVSCGVWHTVISLVKDSVLFEVKECPFIEGLAKEFADWSPEERSEASINYLEAMRSLFKV
jgi:cupin fold WbuC family metalloprotein